MRKKRQLGLLIVTVLSACLFLIWGLIKADAKESIQPLPEQQSDLPSPKPVEESRPRDPDVGDDVPPYVTLPTSGPAEELPELQQLILDLRDDDIPYNARDAMWQLANRLPDDTETVEILIDTLYSDDWQQRQIAGYILSRWATLTDLSGNRRFLEVMVEALRYDKPLGPMYLTDTAEIFLCAQGGKATDLLQVALTSDDEYQRIYAAFILAVSLKIPPESRETIMEILSEPHWGLSDNYRQSAWTLCAISDENQQSDPSAMSADQVYVVEQGDTLEDIAWVYNTGWRMLAMYNCLPNPDLIEPGMRIFIPGTLTPRTLDELHPPSYPSHIDDSFEMLTMENHVLYPGETVEDVARQYSWTVEEIMLLNGISNSDDLKPGTVLQIPCE